MKTIILCLIALLAVGCSHVGQLEDIKLGMSQNDVKNELGSPAKIHRVEGRSEVVRYDLQKSNKPLQLVLAPICLGLNFLAYDTYFLEYTDGHLSRISKAVYSPAVIVSQ